MAQHDTNIFTLLYEVTDCSSETAVGKKENVVTKNWEAQVPSMKRSYWAAYGWKDEHILLDLGSTNLLCFLKIFNRSVSSISVHLSKSRSGPFIQVRDRVSLPLHKVTDVCTGSLPCQYVKLTCHNGSPISLFGVGAFGVPSKHVDMHMGADMHPLLVRNPKRLLYNGALNPSVPIDTQNNINTRDQDVDDALQILHSHLPSSRTRITSSSQQRTTVPSGDPLSSIDFEDECLDSERVDSLENMVLKYNRFRVKPRSTPSSSHVSISLHS
eukprot:GILK01006387.1.p1 GENE.GILK01006387.1~~GILK01006387.1.p1  ORF type:complete len:283 (+),score=37.44 GILK01006387.1:41-850(+)